MGMALAIVGTVLLNTGNYAPLYIIPAVFSRVDERDAAWAKLFDGQVFPQRLDLVNSISPDAEGFRSLLALLRRHSRVATDLVAKSIGIENQMLYGDEVQKIGQLAVVIHYEGEEDPRVVAWAEDVSRWIEAERLQWALSFGFPTLSLGLLLSLVALVMDRRRSKRRRESPRN